MDEREIERLTQRLRFRVGYEVGFACPDVDDLAQETLRRFLVASQAEKQRSPDATSAFINGICRNVISEYRRRLYRDVPMPEIMPEPPVKGLPETTVFELRQAIDQAMTELSARDRLVLQSFYLEERTTEEVLELSGLSRENLRVVICRAKERFRQIYSRGVQCRSSSRH